MPLKNVSGKPAEELVDEIIDKDSSDVSPIRETWRHNKKQRTFSQPRKFSIACKATESYRSTEFPTSRPGGQQHVSLFISMQSQSTQTSPGMFYPPYPFLYQHMWLNFPQCDSGLCNLTGRYRQYAPAWRRRLLKRLWCRIVDRLVLIPMQTDCFCSNG